MQDVVGKTLFRIKMNEKSFALNPLEDEQIAFSVKGNISELWHKRLGHFNYKGLLQMKSKEVAIGLPELVNQVPSCKACQIGK